MRIDQAGNDGATLKVDRARACSRQRPDIGRGPDRDDPAVPHGERLRCRQGRVEGHDLAVEQDGVGVLADGG
jgi:hypothetical protein